MIANTLREDYVVIDAGIDWVTCTAKNTDSALAFERLADDELDRQTRSGVRVIPQSRLGYEGYAGEHFYFGRREHDLMMQITGHAADSLGRLAIPIASNVSRLDLQVTIYTEGTQEQFAADGWEHLKALPNGNGRPRSFSLIVGHPVGQTLYVNSRSSDNFGRIYDKGIEARVGPAGLLWRYEVEFKRKVAKHESLRAVLSEQPTAYVGARVHSWMTERGVDCPWSSLSALALQDRLSISVDRDVLTWFRESVSKTVGKAIKRYGLKAVLESLNLQEQVTPKTRT